MEYRIEQKGTKETKDLRYLRLLLLNQSRLVVLQQKAIFGTCRFTSFIAKNARATAKSLCVPAIGRAQPVRTAVPKNCPRSFPRSPLPAPAIVPRRQWGAETVAAAVAAGIATADIEFVAAVYDRRQLPALTERRYILPVR